VAVTGIGEDHALRKRHGQHPKIVVDRNGAQVN